MGVYINNGTNASEVMSTESKLTLDYKNQKLTICFTI